MASMTLITGGLCEDRKAFRVVSLKFVTMVPELNETKRVFRSELPVGGQGSLDIFEGGHPFDYLRVVSMRRQ
jgi:hypothetical protein